MISELKTGKKVVGVKQTRRAVSAGLTETVFLAMDADPSLLETISALCKERQVTICSVPTMRELGEACGISVGAAAAALMAE